MKIIVRNTPSELFRLSRLKQYARISDRLKVVGYAILGETNEAIAEIIRRPMSFVGRWIGRYNKGGVDALNDIPKTGQPKRLKSTDEARFKTRILEGTKLNDGIVRLNGKAIIKILKVEFKAKYSLSGVYKLLHRMGLSWIRPRPIHPLNDKQKMEDWKKALPLLSKKSKKNTERKRSKSGSKTKLVMANKEGWCQSGRKKIQGQK